MRAPNSPPNASSSDSALTSPMALSANINQPFTNEPFTKPVEVGTLANDGEGEVLNPAPKIRMPTDEAEHQEHDADSRDQDAQVIEDVDHEERPSSVTGDIAEFLPMLDRQTNRTSSASNLVHPLKMSNQDQSIEKRSIYPTLSMSGLSIQYNLNSNFM